MLPFLVVVFTLVNFACSTPTKAPQRGCNGQELQKMLDCMLTDQKSAMKAADSAIARCITVNKCTFGDLWGQDPTVDYLNNTVPAVYDENNANFSNSTGYEDPEMMSYNNPFSQFTSDVIDKCMAQNEAYLLSIQPEIVNCVKNSNSLLKDFDYPKLPEDVQTSSDATREKQAPSSTCQKDSLNACANGRYEVVDRDMCKLQMNCMQTCKNCNFTLTTNALCRCADRTIRGKFQDLKKNFTDCLLINSPNVPKTWQPNVSKEDEEYYITEVLQKYCFNCVERAAQPCGKEDLEDLAWCMRSEGEYIEECYRV